MTDVQKESTKEIWKHNLHQCGVSFDQFVNNLRGVICPTYKTWADETLSAVFYRYSVDEKTTHWGWRTARRITDKIWKVLFRISNHCALSHKNEVNREHSPPETRIVAISVDASVEDHKDMTTDDRNTSPAPSDA